MLSAFHKFFTSATILADLNALLYSAKSFAAAMLAYYIALSLGLHSPSWSIITVYIVSQSSVGASLSRCVYRLAGTLAGAAMTVIIVPNFVHAPIICSLVLTGWITGCLYLSQLDRTPRAYAFVLAGYTASLIGFPGVFDPGTIFDTAITRVQEITIGVICASLIHRYVMPKRLSGMFNSKLASTLESARQMVAVALEAKVADRGKYLKLAEALQTLDNLGHHLPYDIATTTSSRKARQLIHDRLTRLLVVCSQLHDSLLEIKSLDTRRSLLVNEISKWLACKSLPQRQSMADALLDRCLALQPETLITINIDNTLQVNFISRLQEAIRIIQQCEQLADAIYSAKPLPRPEEGKTARGYVYHQDHLPAVRSALGGFAIIFTGCLVWIYTAWPDGAVAVSILGVCCTLFGNFDTPAPHIVKYIIGSVYGVAISLFYSFVLLPQVSEFIVLVAVLAPVYLLAGSLQARPATTFMAMGITLTLPILSELGAQYSGHFDVAVNTTIALFAATGFAVISMTFLQTVEASRAVNRLLYRCHHDIRQQALRLPSHDVHWTNLMIDRTALLLPRLHRSRHSTEQVLNQVVNYLRMGLATSYLRRLQRKLTLETGSQVRDLLRLLARDEPANVLLQRIDLLLLTLEAGREKTSYRLIESLIDLRTVLTLTDGKRTDDC